MSLTADSPVCGATRAPRARILQLLVVATATMLAGCSDLSSPTDMTRAPGGPAHQVETVDLETEIQELLGQFPRGLSTVAQARWENVKRQWTMPNRSGRVQYLALVTWIREKTPQLTPVSGESREQTAARLVLYRSL